MKALAVLIGLACVALFWVVAWLANDDQPPTIDPTNF